MNRSVATLLTVSIAFAGCATFSGTSTQSPFDLLIVGGTIVDGTGARAYQADVGVRRNRIDWIGRSKRVSARDTINAKALVVAPGFIDVHNHPVFDMTFGAERRKRPELRLSEPYVFQGVTTAVGGADGGFAPTILRDIIATANRNGIGTNIALYVGHNGIREEVMQNDQKRDPTSAEMDRMKALVREGMELGAVGLSTGLMYEPGLFSKTDEIVDLAKQVAPFAGIYDSHVRDPAHNVIESDREAIEIGERAGIPPKIAHEKAVGLENAGLIQQVIALVTQARARGVDAVTDQYPYDAAAVDDIETVFQLPDSVLARAGGNLKTLLRDSMMRQRIREWSEQGVDGGFSWLKATGYTHWRFIQAEEFPELVGRYVSEVAAERKTGGFDFLADLFLAAARPVTITYGAIKEQDVRDLLVQPWNMIASDGYLRDGVVNHPRTTGTFPRVLGHYVREQKLLSLEEAVRKMTWLPAEYIGLLDRGRIAEGMAADFAIFDPMTIRDRSTYAEPRLLSEGVRYVLVNGIPVLWNGTITGKTPGQFIRRQRNSHKGSYQ